MSKPKSATQTANRKADADALVQRILFHNPEMKNSVDLASFANIFEQTGIHVDSRGVSETVLLSGSDQVFLPFAKG